METQKEETEKTRRIEKLRAYLDENSKKLREATKAIDDPEIVKIRESILSKARVIGAKGLNAPTPAEFFEMIDPEIVSELMFLSRELAALEIKHASIQELVVNGSIALREVLSIEEMERVLNLSGADGVDFADLINETADAVHDAKETIIADPPSSHDCENCQHRETCNLRPMVEAINEENARHSQESPVEESPVEESPVESEPLDAGDDVDVCDCSVCRHAAESSES